jgi:hypothetical protein
VRHSNVDVDLFSSSLGYGGDRSEVTTSDEKEDETSFEMEELAGEDNSINLDVIINQGLIILEQKAETSSDEQENGIKRDATGNLKGRKFASSASSYKQTLTLSMSGTEKVSSTIWAVSRIPVSDLMPSITDSSFVNHSICYLCS